MINKILHFAVGYFIFIATVGVFAFAGYILEKIIYKRLKTLAEKTPLKIDDIIIHSFAGMLPILFGIIGFYIALDRINLPSHLQFILEKVVVIGSVGIVSIIFIRIAISFLEHYMQTIKEVAPATSIIKTLIKVIIIATFAMIIIQSLGIPIAPIITAFGIGGLAVALAFQDTLSNLFAGFYITIAKQVKVGDFIKLENGEHGYIMDIGWRNTLIRTVQNNIIIVPNTKFANSILTNYCGAEEGFNVPIQLGVSYTTDLKKVEEVTLEVARQVLMVIPGGITQFEPQIRFTSIGTKGINFDVILRVKEYKYYALIKHEFLKQIHQRYQVENIHLVGVS